MSERDVDMTLVARPAELRAFVREVRTQVRAERCPDCRGRGWDWVFTRYSEDKESCRACDGSGRRNQSRPSISKARQKP